MNSHIADILDAAGLTDVAYRRTDLEYGHGEFWDITLPDEDTTIRLIDDDGQIHVYLFTGGRAQIESGHATFARRLAAPEFVAMVVDQLVADYTVTA